MEGGIAFVEMAVILVIVFLVGLGRGGSK